VVKKPSRPRGSTRVTSKRFGSDDTKLVYQGYSSVWQTEDARAWEIVEKPNAVAFLVYHRDRRQVVFVSQYRLPVGHSLPEVPAGHIEERPADISPAFWAKKSMAREAKEELGVTIDPNRFELISAGGVYSSPGFTTEQLYLAYLEIGDGDIEDKERTFGVQSEGESIKRFWVNVRELRKQLELGSFYDLKTLTLIYWFLKKKYPQIKKQLRREKHV